VKRPGVQVRSRRGYVAPRGRAPEPNSAPAGTSPVSAAASEMLSSPVPLAGIPLQLFAAPFRSEAPNARVALALEFAAGDFRFEERNGVHHDVVEVLFSSLDAKGEIRSGDRHVLTMDMSPATLARAREYGMRVLSQIDLPPGRYQLRAAAAEEGNNRSGSVLYDLEVPDFFAPGLTMSGVALTSVWAQAAPTVTPNNPLADVLPGPVATLREFERKDELALYVEFYENAPGAAPHAFDIAMTVRADDGRVVAESREERSSTELQGSSGGYGFSARLPLAGFAPGTYVIRVEGRSRASGPDAAIGRDVLIRVR
jgi:hypothetical protein